MLAALKLFTIEQAKIIVFIVICVTSFWCINTNNKPFTTKTKFTIFMTQRFPCFIFVLFYDCREQHHTLIVKLSECVKTITYIINLIYMCSFVLFMKQFMNRRLDARQSRKGGHDA